MKAFWLILFYLVAVTQTTWSDSNDEEIAITTDPAPVKEGNQIRKHSPHPRPHLTLKPRRLKSLHNAAANVKFHVWYDSNPLASNSPPQRLQVKVRPRVPFAKVMKTAASQNSAFAYDYTQHDIGKYITTIGGVPEDLEGGVYWFLYKLKAEPDPFHPPTKDQLTSKGVDGVQVRDGDIYLFWRKRGTH